ncbi:rho GTPase-activating protein 26-like [Salvelinus alpinus]
MGLPALEFSDCYLDSPQFRDRLKSHELELDKTNKFIKELIKDGKALIQALKSIRMRRHMKGPCEIVFQGLESRTVLHHCVVRPEIRNQRIEEEKWGYTDEKAYEERDNQEARITEIHSIVHWLPEKNRQMLDLLTKHLANVASHHQQNLMTVANLGVVFGPTLLRPQEETVAAIMDIKFQNIVVEILIENHERIFKDMPVPGGGPANLQLNLQPRRRSTESKAPSCSERPLTLFHTPTHSQKVEERNSVVVNSTLELQQPQPAQAKAPHNNPSATPSSSAAVNHNSSGSHGHSLTPRNSLTSTDGDQDRGLTARQNSQSRPNSLLNPKSRTSIPTSPASPSPTSPRSPSWPMFSAPSSPQPASSTSSDSSPISIPGRQARALYACKAEHHSELSFIAGTTFENVHSSREPGWLEGTLDGRTGLIPENYVEFV